MNRKEASIRRLNAAIEDRGDSPAKWLQLLGVRAFGELDVERIQEVAEVLEEGLFQDTFSELVRKRHSCTKNNLERLRERYNDFFEAPDVLPEPLRSFVLAADLMLTK